MFKKYKTKMLLEDTLRKVSDDQLINFQPEPFNDEYEGITFEFNGETFKSRLAKKTPNKKGYFVAFWQKDAMNKNIPFDLTTMADKLIVNVIDGVKQGQFIFPKHVLAQYGIITSEHYKGKMAMRVYTSWDTELNSTARKTQQWQTQYFVDLSDKQVENTRIRNLYLSK